MKKHLSKYCIGFILFAFILPPYQTLAAINKAITINKPFGGRIQSIRSCQEPLPGFLLTLGPPLGGNFLLTPASRLYPYASFFPGTWNLGLAASISGPCMGSGQILAGFGLGGILKAAGVEMISRTVVGIKGIQEDVLVLLPGGKSFIVAGPAAEFLKGLSGVAQYAPLFGGAFSVFSGDIFGGALSLGSFLDPTGTVAAVSLGTSLLGLAGVNILPTKKLKNLGPAYPIIKVGTSSNF